ncbi:MAG: flavodoxin domain-containing protein [Acidimicrobiia bacterium]|nr:flavodoxin domain-containing protein [Acidimicrobiia bacterium]
MLVAFASRHGSTEEIAAEIGAVIRRSGFTVEVRAVDTVTSVRGFDAVVVGSAVYHGAWQPSAVDFATRHAAALQPVPVWIFSSGPLGPVEGDLLDQPDELGRLEALLVPEGHRVLAGRLDTTLLDFGERMSMLAAGRESGDHRDWDEIRTFGREIAFVLGGGRAARVHWTR